MRIAFDGDAVLFSDEAERVYQRDGLDAFTQHETAHALQPLPPGPFKPLLEALHRLQAASGTDVPMRMRTALVTARSAPAHERAVRTLMEWDIAVDEALFLGGLDKGEFLKAFEPDFYFDDQRGHIDSARLHVATGHVPFGVANLRGARFSLPRRRGRPRGSGTSALRARQRSLACGQRGWNAQPGGGASGLGTSPATGVRALPLICRSGTASSSMRV